MLILLNYNFRFQQVETLREENELLQTQVSIRMNHQVFLQGKLDVIDLTILLVGFGHEQ